MKTIYVTDGDADKIIEYVGLTLLDFTTPDGDLSGFGDVTYGYKRQVDVDLTTLDGVLSGAGMIGYFREAALGAPSKGAKDPLLVALIAEGARTDVVIPPLFRHTAESLAGKVPPHCLSYEEQHALFDRVLGAKWPALVKAYREKYQSEPA